MAVVGEVNNDKVQGTRDNVIGHHTHTRFQPRAPGVVACQVGDNTERQATFEGVISLSVSTATQFLDGLATGSKGIAEPRETGQATRAGSRTRRQGSATTPESTVASIHRAGTRSAGRIGTPGGAGKHWADRRWITERKRPSACAGAAGKPSSGRRQLAAIIIPAQSLFGSPAFQSHCTRLFGLGALA